MEAAHATYGSGDQSFTLVFEQGTCDICNTTVHVTEACACGDHQPRPDVHVEARTVAARPLLDRLSGPVVPSSPIDLSGALDELATWIDDLFAGLQALGGDAADASGLVPTVDRIVALRRRVASNPLLRPERALWDPLRKTIDGLAGLAIRELECCIAPSPAVLPAAQVEAQAQLDGASAAIATLGARLDYWGIEPPVGLTDQLIAAAAAAYERTGATDILDLDSRGAELYERIAGPGRKPPSGVGMALLVDLGQADNAFDVERVYRVAGLVYGRLDRDRMRFSTLLDDPAWRDDLRHARQVFGDATVKTLMLVRAFQGERRQEAEAVIELGSKLTERVSQHLVGLILAAGGGKLKRTAGWEAVHQGARQAGLADILLGFDDRVRNADAHVDFDVSATEVKLGRNRAKPERLSDDELVDLVLAAVESVASIFAAIDCVIAEIGHPAGGDLRTDMEPGEVVRILAAIAGLEATRVELKNGLVELTGTPVGSARVRPLSVAAMLGPSLPEDTRVIRVSIKGSGSAVRGETRYTALRRFQEASTGTKEIAFLEYGAQATLNGRPVLSQDHVRKAMAVYLGQTMETGYSANAETLEAILAVARRLGDSQVIESATSFVESLRSREGLRPRSLPSRIAVERLAVWLELDPGPIRDGASFRT
jgi:hypothetical protein